MSENERRKFLKAAGVSLAGVAGMSILGCQPGAEPLGGEPPVPEPDEVIWPEPVKDETPASEPAPDDAADDQAAKREEYAEKLKKLGEEKRREASEHYITATCYVPAPVGPPMPPVE